ncbi:MAG: LPS export ABC transporter periplasmic protein LptC [Rhodobacterales bacterium]|nr:LPS export ABC transporter periplasmic protein LptC [Rhodobacterales bacterium]
MIFRGDNFHTRLVNWAKIILPLVALGLLSTLFLLSRKVDLNNQMPVADVDLAQRAHDQGATNPNFAGVTPTGEEILFQAQSVRPDLQNPDLYLADEAQARLSLNGGGEVDITSRSGIANQAEMMATLEGDVLFETTTGYVMRTDSIDTALTTLYAETPGAVTGTGPPGDLSAGRMLLTSDPDTGIAHLRFTQGVKLIYIPAKSKD